MVCFGCCRFWNVDRVVVARLTRSVFPSDLDVAFTRLALEELERTCGFDTDLRD